MPHLSQLGPPQSTSVSSPFISPSSQLAAVGDAVGTAVGDSEGTGVGLPLGTGVGDFVGTAVGANVGSAVGLRLGENETHVRGEVEGD